MKEDEISPEIKLENMEEDSLIVDVESLKVEINNLIWKYSPSQITLGEADRRALIILDKILKEPSHDH